MLISVVAALAIGPAIADGPVCPMAGESVSVDSPALDFRGVRYRTCCMNCMGAFSKDPVAAIKAEKNKGKVLGTSLFDPVSGAQINTAKVKGGYSDFQGVRFYFVNADNKSAFDANPKKYGTIPEKEAMFCPVQKVDLKNYYGTNGFVDFEGVRYYACCGSCFPAMKGNIAKFAPNAKDHIADAKPLAVPPAIAKITGG